MIYYVHRIDITKKIQQRIKVEPHVVCIFTFNHLSFQVELNRINHNLNKCVFIERKQFDHVRDLVLIPATYITIPYMLVWLNGRAADL